MKVFIVLSFAAAAIAQTNSSTGTIGGAIGPVPVRAQLVNGGWTSTSSFVGVPGGTVTGAPYSAEEVTEHIQTLADGTHISQPSPQVKLYRDSQGRTRTERTFPLPPGASAAGVDAPGLIEIFDAVSGARYTLEPRNHTARKISFPSTPPPPPPPNSATVSANRTTQINRAIQVLPALAPAPPGFASDAQAQRPQFSRESLGTQTVEGVLAEGSRTTVVYPIGAVGNDRPITTVSETWMSPELKTVVLSKNSDPRSGESTTRLTNISRSEPAPSLFQIPPDYEVVDPQVAVPKQ
jgi:hypothetical protein